METMSVTTRRMTEADLATVVALEASLQPMPWSEGMFRDELAAEHRTYLVFGDPVVAFGGVMVIGEEAHITNLLVAPASRRQGVGRRLMADLIRAAIAQGARHVTLEVRADNQAARRLYSRLGLVPVGVRSRYYGDDDALVMWAHDIDQPDYQDVLT